MQEINPLVLAVALVLLAGPASAQFVPGAEFHNQPALSAINILPAYQAGLTGAGIKAGLVDSGINPNHVEFANAIVAGYDAISDRSGTGDFASFLQDHVNHGTFTASILAARLDGADRSDNMHGVAHNAGLVIGAMNFYDDDGITAGYIAAAMDYVSSQSTKVINNSWEFYSGTIDPGVNYRNFASKLPSVISAINTALDRGSVLVFTTGNEAAANPATPSVVPFHDPTVRAKGGFIVVAATTNDGRSLASYSNRCGVSKDYCIAAPGGDEIAGQPFSATGILGADRDSNTGYFHQAGTSAAAPIVSGAVALVAEQFPWMSNKNLAVTILTTGNRAANPDVEWGRGLLDVGKAIQGPGLFEEDFEANVPGGYASVFSNGIGHRAGLDGGLVKRGAGTLVLSGSNTYTGQTQVDAGTLVVNGGLSSPVTVASDGTLRGIGKLAAALTVNGRLAPGDSHGTLEVSNTVTMRPGSIYRVYIDGSTGEHGAATRSRLLLTGAASRFIANGVLQPVLPDSEASASSRSAPVLGDSFRVVSAEGGISGRFSSLDQPNGLANGTQLVAFYDVFSSRSIDLRAAPTSYAAYLAGANANTRSTASALDQILRLELADRASTAQTQLLYLTAGQSASELPGYARSLAGEIHGAAAASTAQASQRLARVVARRLGFKSSVEVAGENALWLDVGSNHRRRKGDDTASGFTSDLNQLTLGADLFADGNTRFGIGLSHADSEISARIGRASLAETTGFAYVQHAFADVLFAGMAGYGTGSTKTSRPDPTALITATRRFGSETTTANTVLNTRLSKAMVIGQWRVEPSASVTWQKSRRSAFDEGDALAALRVAGSSNTGVRTLAGFALGSLVQDPLSSRTTYRFNLGLGYDAGKLTRPRVSATLAGIEVTTKAPTQSRAFIQADVSATVRFAPRIYGYFGLNTELRAGLQDTGVNVGVVAAF